MDLVQNEIGSNFLRFYVNHISPLVIADLFVTEDEYKAFMKRIHPINFVRIFTRHILEDSLPNFFNLLRNEKEDKCIECKPRYGHMPRIRLFHKSRVLRLDHILNSLITVDFFIKFEKFFI